MEQSHDHDDEHGETSNEVDTPAVALVALVGFVLLFATVLWLESYYYSSEDQAKMRADAGTPAQIALIRSQQQMQLAGEGGKLPIDKAMEWVVRETAREGGR